MTELPTLLASIIRPEVRAMSAYKVADATGMIKLDAMENPYTWPEDAIERWLDTLRACPVNRYPDPQARELAEILRDMNGIGKEYGLLLGNGSDEIIQILMMVLQANAAVLAPEPTFVMYKQIAQSLGLQFHGVPLQPEDFGLDLAAMLEAIEKHQPALIFLSYPNNPTGNLFDVGAIEKIISAAPGLVVIDEAYEPFAGASFMPRLQEFGNLLVMRTVSKLGLAGLRLGYLAGRKAIVDELDKIRLPYNINVLTQATVCFALRQQALFAPQTAAICAERSTIMQQLSEIPGITAFPSAANFILFRSVTGNAEGIFTALKSQGVLIKNLHPQGGILTGCLRVTIGMPKENKAFITALRDCLNI